MKKILLAALAMLPMVALAHPGHEQTSVFTGLIGGVLHPLLGLDHLLALLAVGLMSARLEGKQRFIIPAAYIAMMAVGFYAAHAGVHGLSAGAIEVAISVSILAAVIFVVMAVMLKKHQLVSSMGAWGMTGFAIFHGLAHGLEVPAAASLNGFAVGFLSASALLVALDYYAVNYIALLNMKKMKA